MNIIYLKINRSNGRVTDLSNNLLTPEKLVVINHDHVLFAVTFVENLSAGSETPVNKTTNTGMRIACDVVHAEDADPVFSYSDYNQGHLPSFEDASIGQITFMTQFNAPALDTHLGSNSNSKVFIEFSGIGPGPDFFGYTERPGAIEITVKAQVHKDGETLPQPPSPTYLTAAETATLIDGVDDLTALAAIPEASCRNNQTKFVASEGYYYWYDQDAGTGDVAPGDQTGGTGFWIKSSSALPDIAQNTLIGRNSAGSGPREELSATLVRAILGVLQSIDEDNFASNSDQHVPTQQSVKAYVDAAIANLIDSSPGALDTLNELAAALGDDPNFATTMTNALAGKHSKTADVDLTDTYILKAVLGLGVTAATNKTIIAGTFTQDQFAHKMLNESGAATDDLVSVTPATGQKLLLLTMGNSGQVPTIKHGTGTNQFSLQDDADLECKNNACYLFWLDGTVWKLIGGSGSGGIGGGAGTAYPTTEDTISSTTTLAKATHYNTTKVWKFDGTSDDQVISHDNSTNLAAGDYIWLGIHRDATKSFKINFTNASDSANNNTNVTEFYFHPGQSPALFVYNGGNDWTVI